MEEFIEYFKKWKHWKIEIGTDKVILSYNGIVIEIYKEDDVVIRGYSGCEIRLDPSEFDMLNEFIKAVQE